IAVCDSRKNHFGTAEFLQFGSGVLGLSINVMMRAKLSGERLFVLAARDGDRSEAHADGVLDSKMAEPAQAKNGDETAAARAAVAQRVEGGDAGAHQGSGVRGREAVRHQCNSDGRGEHVLGITAIEGNAGNLERHLAAEEVT